MYFCETFGVTVKPKTQKPYSYVNGVSLVPSFDSWWDPIQERLQKTQDLNSSVLKLQKENISVTTSVHYLIFQKKHVPLLIPRTSWGSWAVHTLLRIVRMSVMLQDKDKKNDVLFDSFSAVSLILCNLKNKMQSILIFNVSTQVFC